jgi:hypothetical protein
MLPGPSALACLPSAGRQASRLTGLAVARQWFSSRSRCRRELLDRTLILALDFFTADLLNGARVYVLAVIEHGTRRVRVLGATGHPVPVMGRSAGPEPAHGPRRRRDGDEVHAA